MSEEQPWKPSEWVLGQRLHMKGGDTVWFIRRCTGAMQEHIIVTKETVGLQQRPLSEVESVEKYK